MMLVQYLLDHDIHIEIPGVDAVCNTFATPRDALAMALGQERTVTEQISRLAGVAREMSSAAKNPAAPKAAGGSL